MTNRFALPRAARTPIAVWGVALIAVTALPATVRAASLPAVAQESQLDLKGDIDRSIRWLRARQDPVKGSYGSGVEDTAWVLRALAVSPRHYQRGDGPFVANALEFLETRQGEHGAIADAGSDDEHVLRQTAAAAAALSQLVDERSRPVLAKALGFLGRNGTDDLPGLPHSSGPPQDAHEAEARAVKLLAGRNADGSWSDEGGAVGATARAVVELAACYSKLRKPKVARGATPLPVFDHARRQEVDASILRGARFLLKQADGGRFGAPGRPDAGLTAMVLAALLAVPQPRPDDVQTALDSGLDWLASLQREDGSIHDGKLANYITSAAIMALAKGGHERHRVVIEGAREFLIGLQSDEGEGYSADHHYYGGIGYGGDERPDLSNLQMALEALAASGLESEHEAFQRALTFLQRCQNRSESSDLASLSVREGEQQVISGNDGGAAYMPGNSPAGYVELADGSKIARSYGSMSYALLKGYVFAGLERDDPRVQAVWKWLQENYTLDVNPGFEHAADPSAAYQGLFYYFHTMARALEVYGADVIVDGAGREHAWRSQLCGRVLAMQSKLDGSWVNQNAPRWWEGNPLLATSYALLTLDSARPKD